MTTDSATDSMDVPEQGKAPRRPWRIASQVALAGLAILWLINTGGVDFSVVPNLGTQWPWLSAALGLTVAHQVAWSNTANNRLGLTQATIYQLPTSLPAKKLFRWSIQDWSPTRTTGSRFTTSSSYHPVLFYEAN